MVEKGSSIAGEILKEYRRRKYYEEKNKEKKEKKLEEYQEKMIEKMLEEMEDADRV